MHASRRIFFHKQRPDGYIPYTLLWHTRNFDSLVLERGYDEPFHFSRLPGDEKH